MQGNIPGTYRGGRVGGVAAKWLSLDPWVERGWCKAPSALPGCPQEEEIYHNLYLELREKVEALQRQRGAERDLHQELELSTAGMVRLGWLACDECVRSQPGRAHMCPALPVLAPGALPEHWCPCPFPRTPGAASASCFGALWMLRFRACRMSREPLTGR